MAPGGFAPSFAPAPQFVGAPGFVQAQPKRTAPPAPARLSVAAPTGTPPLVRAKGATEPRSEALALPSPEKLSVTRRTEIDWTETRRTLDTVGATEPKLELLTNGAY